MNSDRLRELVDRYHLGIASEHEVAELDTALREDSHARDVFIAAARLETNLYDEAINSLLAAMDATGPWEPVPILITACEPGGPAEQRFVNQTLARMHALLDAAGRLEAGAEGQP